jgi:hypothetical protein
MIILNKGQANTLTLNINNNTRTDFTGYTLTFTHVLSQEQKSYTVSKSSLNYSENDRYCSIQLMFQQPGNDLNYEGDYNLQIYGDVVNLVYTNIARLLGTTEDTTFVEYASPNEDNENYIYIQD